MNKSNGNFKNKGIFIFGIVFFICVVAVILAVSFINMSNDYEDSGRNIYFLNSSTNEIVAEKHNIENGSALLSENKKKEYVDAVMREFLKGPKNAGLTAAVPENVSVDCNFKENSDGNGSVQVTFSREYNDLSEGQALVCSSAVRATLREIDFVESIDIIVEGFEESTGETESESSKIAENVKDENLEINPSIAPYKTDNRVVKLYFSDENAMGLVEEERNIEINENQSAERKIVEELIKGPQNESLVAVIPPETKINNINTEGGICYVDVSKDFISHHSGGSTGELLTIYSIVNSLTELDYIKQIQFLIDGVKETSFAGHLDFSKTFERDESRIIKED